MDCRASLCILFVVVIPHFLKSERVIVPVNASDKIKEESRFGDSSLPLFLCQKNSNKISFSAMIVKLRSALATLATQTKENIIFWSN